MKNSKHTKGREKGKKQKNPCHDTSLGLRAPGCAKWNEAFKEPLYQFYFYITGILVEHAHVFGRVVSAIAV